jgi:hypothetical protein
VGLRSWARENSAALGSVAFTVAIGVGVGLYLWLHRAHRDENGPGKIESLVIVDGDEGRGALVLSEYVEHGDDTSDWKNWRFSQVEASTGKIRGRIALPETKSMRCYPALRERMWCRHDERLELRDVVSLAVVTDDAKLAKTSADLRAGIMVDRTMIVDEKTSSLEVETKDGYHVAIDPRTLATRRLEKREPTGPTRSVLGRSASGECTSASIDGVPGEELALTGSPRARLTRRRSGASNLQGTPLGDRTFLSARILCVDGTALSINGPPAGPRAFVVAEATTLDDKVAKTLYTALDESGRQLWQTEDARGSIGTAGIVNSNVLALLVNGATQHVLGIQVSTGAVLYRYDGTRR